MGTIILAVATVTYVVGGNAFMKKFCNPFSGVKRIDLNTNEIVR